MKIVIGIDESPYAIAALEWVKQVRWPLGTRFVLVSAIPIEIMSYALGGPGGMWAVPEIEENLMRAHQDMATRAEENLQAAHLNTAALVEHGDPRDVIVRVAASEKADLVIVGSHGRSGMSKLLMGSVASHVVTHAPCTVLVIKQPRRTSTKKEE